MIIFQLILIYQKVKTYLKKKLYCAFYFLFIQDLQKIFPYDKKIYYLFSAIDKIDM